MNLPLHIVYDSVKGRTGRSPYNLVIEKRIERARTMLQHSNASIAEIACACGFSSQQPFNGNPVAPVGPHPASAATRTIGRTQTDWSLGDFFLAWPPYVHGVSFD